MEKKDTYSAIAVGTGVLGHIVAAGMNSKAQKIYMPAKIEYEKVLVVYNEEARSVRGALGNLVKMKKRILSEDISAFLEAYRRIAHFQVKQSTKIDELLHYTFEPQDAIELQRLANIYEKVAMGGAAGLTISAMVSMVTDGSMPGVLQDISMASKAYRNGDVNAVADKVCDIVGHGIQSADNRAVLGTAMLATGLTSAYEAVKNLEEGKRRKAEYERAKAELELNITYCSGIRERANMHEELLRELRKLFLQSSENAIRLINKKSGFFHLRKIKEKDFVQEEWELLALVMALALAMKAVIDVPVLGSDGMLYEDPIDICGQTYDKLSILREQSAISMKVDA